MYWHEPSRHAFEIVAQPQKNMLRGCACCGCLVAFCLCLCYCQLYGALRVSCVDGGEGRCKSGYHSTCAHVYLRGAAEKGAETTRFQIRTEGSVDTL